MAQRNCVAKALLLDQHSEHELDQRGSEIEIPSDPGKTYLESKNDDPSSYLSKHRKASFKKSWVAMSGVVPREARPHT